MAMRPQTKEGLIPEDAKFWRNSTIEIAISLAALLVLCPRVLTTLQAGHYWEGAITALVAILVFIVLCLCIKTEAAYAITRNHEELDH